MVLLKFERRTKMETKMKVIKVIDNAMEVLRPLIGMLEVHAPHGKSDFSNARITWWDNEILVTYQKQIFSMGWLDIKKFNTDDVSLTSFEYHKQGDEYFINLSPEVTLFIPVIEIDTESVRINHQIVKLLPGQACIMPARVIHTPPFQNQEEKGVMLVFKKHNLDLVLVSITNPLQFKMEV